MEKEKENPEFQTLWAKRTAYLQKHIELCKALEKQMVSYDNKVAAEVLFEKLCEYFQHVGTVTMDCLIFCPNADAKTELKQSYRDCQKRFVELTQSYAKWLAAESNINAEDEEIGVKDTVGNANGGPLERGESKSTDTNTPKEGHSINASAQMTYEPVWCDGYVWGARMNPRDEEQIEIESLGDTDTQEDERVERAKTEPVNESGAVKKRQTKESFLQKFIPREGLVKRLLKDKYPNLFKKNDDEILRLIESEVDSLEKRSATIAVTGRSGSGKSSFINMLLNLTPDMEGAAAVGVNETTKEPKEYQFPNNKNVKIWDLPGAGTPNFPFATYIEKVQLKRFDMLLILSSSRFTTEDQALLEEAEKRKMTAFFVRTKLQNDVENMAKCYRTSPEQMEKKVLDIIRQDLKQVVQNHHVYLIDNYETRKYDCEQLIRDLVICNKDIKDALVQCINVKVGIMIDLKKEWLLEWSWWYGISLYMSGTKKKDTFENQFLKFRKILNLDDSSIKRDFDERYLSLLKDDIHSASTELLKDERLEYTRSQFWPISKLSGCQEWAKDCVHALAKVYHSHLANVKKISEPKIAP